MSTNHKGYINVYQYAREHGVSAPYIYQMIYAGRLKAVKRGRKWQIPIDAVIKGAPETIHK